MISSHREIEDYSDPEQVILYYQKLTDGKQKTTLRMYSTIIDPSKTAIFKILSKEEPQTSEQLLLGANDL